MISGESKRLVVEPPWSQISPANASGFDTHRDSITSRSGCSHGDAPRTARRVHPAPRAQGTAALVVGARVRGALHARGAVPPPEHTYLDRNSGLPEIYLRFTYDFEIGSA
eukprot:COSAG01_NODE_1192_length_11309_cov_8.575609_13_plen_110_part_00